MEHKGQKRHYRADFSYEPDPREREALSNILQEDLENSLNLLEKKLRRYWEETG